jgi:hypothetical protein
MEEKKEIIRHTSQIKYKKGEHKKFTDLIVMLLSSNTLPYYGEFNTFINFYESTNIDTCGVNITSHGANFYWNRKFTESLLDTEALFILLHEDFHLLFDHSKRSIIYNKEFSNIAQDMIINQIIFDEIMHHEKSKDKVTIPKHHDKFLLDKEGKEILKNGQPIPNPYYNHNMGMFIPIDYPGEDIFEDLYEWLKDEYSKYKERKTKDSENEKNGQDQQDGQKPNNKGNNKGDSQGKGNSQTDGENGQIDENGEPQIPRDKGYGKNGKNGIECNDLDSIFDSFEKGEKLTLDDHIDDDVPESARKSIINDFMQRLKNRGLLTADIEKMLDKIRKSKHDYLKEIKRTLSTHIFGSNKKKSITKPNRREIEGLKGKKKFMNIVNCILDVSGSMCGDFELVLSYIFQNEIFINLIQIDTEVKVTEKIKNKRDLQKMTIKGGGGTVLQPSVDYIVEPKNKLSNFNTVILTDGFTDELDFSKTTKKVLILTTGKPPKYVDPRGIVKCIVIDKENSKNN